MTQAAILLKMLRVKFYVKTLCVNLMLSLAVVAPSVVATALACVKSVIFGDQVSMKFSHLLANQPLRNTRYSFPRFCLLCLLSYAFLSLNLAYGQDILKPHQPITFLLAPEEERTFVLQLKEDDFAEIFWIADRDLSLSFSLYDPSGQDLLENGFSAINDVDDSIPFVAQTSGDYKFTIKSNESRDKESQKITLQYTDTLKLPSKISERAFRKINGYDVKILNSAEEEKSTLLIEKGGRPKLVLKDVFLLSRFYFSDDVKHAYSAKERRSAMLMKSTLDKTGDGTPDVAVEHYSGGAHCCYTMMFFELGETLKPRKPISTGNARMIAIGKNPKGGLRFETADDTFAYWVTSFAQSPMPTVILEFQEGVLRPNFKLMRKPAPSLTKLKNKARVIRKKISLEPYKGVDDPSSGFEVVFWDEMLDLIYSGHEELAWQYLDLVWPAQKQGKAIFQKDFMEQLSKSQFWQMIEKEKKTTEKKDSNPR
ncbi:MAG: hypothetical protein D6687_00205 [Acidobacteria bacterium]|nr:MAG: hypothetical protein D6687_00205 [Acidobacteriota bacterium]